LLQSYVWKMLKRGVTVWKCVECRTRGESESTDARLNLFRVEIEVALLGGRALFRLDIGEVHRLRVLLEGHRSLDFPALISNGQEVHRPVDGHFSSCDIGRCSRQFARDLLTVQAEADVPRAIRFVDVSLLHRGTLLLKPKANVQQNVQHWFLQVQ
jgi:hypothetical protein